MFREIKMYLCKNLGKGATARGLFLFLEYYLREIYFAHCYAMALTMDSSLKVCRGE